MFSTAFFTTNFTRMFQKQLPGKNHHTQTHLSRAHTSSSELTLHKLPTIFQPVSSISLIQYLILELFAYRFVRPLLSLITGVKGYPTICGVITQTLQLYFNIKAIVKSLCLCRQVAYFMLPETITVFYNWHMNDRFKIVLIQYQSNYFQLQQIK